MIVVRRATRIVGPCILAVIVAAVDAGAEPDSLVALTRAKGEHALRLPETGPAVMPPLTPSVGRSTSQASALAHLRFKTRENH